jgi:hypothetical protein
MPSTALATSSKTIRDQAQALARAASAKTKLRLKSAQRVQVPLLATLGATALGLIERLADLEPDALGIDNGVIAGAPIAIAGALMPGQFGEYVMLAGTGMLASGARTTARTLGADGATTEGIG